MPEASSVGRGCGRLPTGKEWRKETRLRLKERRCIPGSGSGRGRPAPRAVGDGADAVALGKGERPRRGPGEPSEY